MKSIISGILLALCLFVNTPEFYAQDHVASNIFPIGGFDFGLYIHPESDLGSGLLKASSLLHDMVLSGFNTMYFNKSYNDPIGFSVTPNGGPSEVPKWMTTTTDKMKTYFGMESNMLHYFTGGKAISPCVERRYFLASYISHTGGVPATNPYEFDFETNPLWNTNPFSKDASLIALDSRTYHTWTQPDIDPETFSYTANVEKRFDYDATGDGDNIVVFHEGDGKSILPYYYPSFTIHYDNAIITGNNPVTTSPLIVDATNHQYSYGETQLTDGDFYKHSTSIIDSEVIRNDSLRLDIIYRFKPSEKFHINSTDVDAGTIESLSHSDPHRTDALFSIQVDVIYKDPNGAVLPVENTYPDVAMGSNRFNICYNDYADSIASTFHSLEPVTLTKFAGQNYAIKRIHAIPLTVLSGTTTLYAMKIECRLISNHNLGIYFRGFRTRSTTMDQILSGYLDNCLTAILKENLNQLKTLQGKEALAGLGALSLGGELQQHQYREIAYLDKLLYNLSDASIFGNNNPCHLQFYSFQSNNVAAEGGGSYSSVKAIYEDQNGGNPPCPPIMQESFDITSISGENDGTTDWSTKPPMFPADGVPAWIRHYNDSRFSISHLASGQTPGDDITTFKYGMDYTDMGFGTAGWDNTLLATLPTNLTTWKGDVLSQKLTDYPEYTFRMQHYLGKSDNDHMKAALSIFEYNNAVGKSTTIDYNQKWYSLLSTIGTAGWVNDNTELPYRHYSALSSSPKDDWYITNVWHEYVMACQTDVFNYNATQRYALRDKPFRFDELLKSTSLITAPPNPAHGPEYFVYTRPQVSSEIRADGWDALCWGAKGIFFNSVGNDHGADIGMTTENYEHDFDGWFKDKDGCTSPSEHSGTSPCLKESLLNLRLGLKGSNKEIILPKQPSGVTDQISFDYRPIVHTDGHGHITSTGDPDFYEYQWIPSSLTPDNTVGWSSYLNGGYTGSPSTFVISTSSTPTTTAYSSSTIFPDQSNWVLFTEGSDPISSFFKSGTPAYTTYGPTHTPSPYDFLNTYLWNYAHRYPLDISDEFNVWLPTFYGFKERFDGATRLAKDILPIASTLSKLYWLRSTDTRFGDVTFADPESQYPIKSITTDLVKRYINTFDTKTKTAHFIDSTVSGTSVSDDAEHTFCRVSIFKQKSFPSTKYVMIANPRTWPLYFEPKTEDGNTWDHIKAADESDKNFWISDLDLTEPMLGAIDARIVKFQLNTCDLDEDLYRPYFIKHPSECPSYDLIVRDLRRKTSTHIDSYNYGSSSGSTNYLSVELAPGEGTLLTISPNFGNNFSLTTNFNFNNAARLSSMENRSSQPSLAMAKESHGGIYVCYPQEILSDTMSAKKREPAATVDSIIDNSGKAQTPAICAYPADSSGIGMVYALDYAGPGNDSTYVIFRYASTAAPYNYSVSDTLDRYKSFSDSKAAPAIVPSQSQGLSFWVSWRNPSQGAEIAIVNSLGQVVAQNSFWASNKFETKFISLASHMNPIDTGITGTPSDTCYIAFEEGQEPLSEIFFIKAYHSDSVNPTTISLTGLKDLSIGMPYCEHHYPSIALTPQRHVYVVWESTPPPLVHNSLDSGLFRRHYTTLRDRDNRGVWSKFSSFFGFESNFRTIGAHPDSVSTFPVITAADSNTVAISSMVTTDTSWQDIVRIAWNSPIDNISRLAHYGYFKSSALSLVQPIPKWEIVPMPEESLEPSMAARTKYNGILQPLAYRDNLLIDTNPTYTAHLTAYDFPLSKQIDTLSRFQTLIVKPKFCSCPSTFVAKASDVTVRRNLGFSAFTLLWNGWDWEDTIRYGDGGLSAGGLRSSKLVLSPGDSISLSTTFRVGTFQRGDTAYASPCIQAVADTFGFRLVARKASSNDLAWILDSAIYYAGVFRSSVNYRQAENRLHIVPGSITSDTVYLALEAYTRGHGFNVAPANDNLESYHQVVYDSSIYDIPAPLLDSAGNSYKIATNNPIITKAEEIKPISVDIFPNPYRDFTTANIDAPANLPMRVAVFDAMGRTISTLYNDMNTPGAKTFQIGNSGLADGVYFLRVQAGSQVLTKKFELRR